MSKNLTTSGIARQNVLNNTYALQEIQKAVGMEGVLFENEYRFTKKQLAQFFEVSERTINQCLAKNESELAKNGYGVLSGKRLINFKLAVENQFDPELDFMIKTVRLGVFNFRAFLNLSMLLSDSEKAKEMRSTILDIVIDTINKRTGGGTKYIVDFYEMVIDCKCFNEQPRNGYNFVETDIYKINQAAYRRNIYQNGQHIYPTLRSNSLRSSRS